MQHPRAHRDERGDHLVHAGDRAADTGGQSLAAAAVAPIDDDQRPGFGTAARSEGQDLPGLVAGDDHLREHHEVHAYAPSVELDAHRVDEERRVVTDVEQQGMLRARW